MGPFILKSREEKAEGQGRKKPHAPAYVMNEGKDSPRRNGRRVGKYTTKGGGPSFFKSSPVQNQNGYCVGWKQVRGLGRKFGAAVVRRNHRKVRPVRTRKNRSGTLYVKNKACAPRGG